MQEIFKKIIERLEGRRGIAARDKYESKSSDDRSYYQGADYGYYKAIKIVNQVAEEYKHGHFGCNMNGQHEKCKNCGLRGECSHCNTKWFTEHSNSEIPNMSDEFCEWRNNGIADEWSPSCGKGTYNVFGVAWFKRCPYCGRIIKVVE